MSRAFLSFLYLAAWLGKDFRSGVVSGLVTGALSAYQLLVSLPRASRECSALEKIGRVRLQSDTDLLGALRCNDPAQRENAEARLFKSFQPRISAVLSGVVESGADLDDAVEETFIDVFRGLP